MTAERIDQLRALPDHKIARPEKHGAPLLFLVLTATKRIVAELQPRRSLPRRPHRSFGVSRTFDVGGRINRTSWPRSRMARRQWCALPQASMATTQRGCSAKKARTFSRKASCGKPRRPQPKRVRLKGPLCKVETDDANLFHGCSLRSWMRKHHHFAHSMPSGGASTPSLCRH